MATEGSPFTLSLIEQAAERIRQQIKSGEISQACCMSAAATPVTEAWEAAQELAAQTQLSSSQQQILFDALTPETQKQLSDASYDDFDLIYEWILAKIQT